MAEPLPAFDEVRASARVYAPDFYLSALLAPRARQPHLIALAAFLGDVERIAATIQEPAIAEIRLQWWRDTIQAAQSGDKSGHPIADALGEAIRAHGLPFAEFDGLLDARALDLYADPIPDDAAFTAYLDKADGAAFRLAARCAGSPRLGVSIVLHASRGYAITRLIRTLPMFLARGRAAFPGFDTSSASLIEPQLEAWRQQARERVALARAIWRQSPREERLACLPIAVVEPYLRTSERPGHDPATALTDIEPLTRVWRFWQAHTLGRF